MQINASNALMMFFILIIQEILIQDIPELQTLLFLSSCAWHKRLRDIRLHFSFHHFLVFSRIIYCVEIYNLTIWFRVPNLNTYSASKSLSLEIIILYELHRRNVKLCHYEIHKRGALTLGHIFEDFTSDGLIFELFKIMKINICQHL